MVYTKEMGICPICKLSAVVTKKWVLNKYSKRYDYLIYHHNGFVHYVNETASGSRRLKKGELKKLLIETINSESFKEGLFNAEDAKEALLKVIPSISLDSIRENLYKLSEEGMLEQVRRGKRIFFLNAVYKERLSFLDDSIKFVLIDLDNDASFKGHILTALIRNDKSWPLYYLPYKIYGDTETDFKSLQFIASDPATNELLKTLIIEDKPKEKRLLLKLNRPLFPNETIKIRFEYQWQEPKQTFFFTAATQMNSFEFVLMGKRPLKIQATHTISTLNEVNDLSNSIILNSNRSWKYIYSVKIKSIKAFSVIHFKWKAL
jgi:hypothetical protein